VYIDWGEDFRRQHDAALPQQAKAAVGFNLGPLALQFILDAGGSLCRPARLGKSPCAAPR